MSNATPEISAVNVWGDRIVWTQTNGGQWQALWYKFGEDLGQRIEELDDDSMAEVTILVQEHMLGAFSPAELIKLNATPISTE